MPGVVDNKKDVFNVQYQDDFKEEDVYFLNSTNLLVKTSIPVFSDSDLASRIKSVIESLISASSEIIPNGLNRVIPKNTKLIGIEVDESMVNLNFSKELLNSDEDMYLKMVESIAYSVLDFKEINGVSIYVEGTNISGQLPIEVPSVITRDFGINKEYDIKRKDGVVKYVVYYLEEIGESKYYVPITKYVNDDREKIKIIIEDLSSSYLYQSNLISVLDKNVELTSYEINEKEMILNFNNSVFLDDGEIIEEVVYPICYSVFDNYDVDRVVIQVNGKEIYKKDKKDIE